MSFFSNLFSKKQELNPIDLSVLKTDMHSHLIPGIDDGSKTMEETIAMLIKFKELGYKKIITTPHIMSDFYKNSSENILKGLEDIRDEIKRINLDIEIEAAAEYYFDETLFHKLENNELMTFSENHVLIEFSFSIAPQEHERLFYDMRIKGYKPREWREKGMLIQMNVNSLFGHYGPGVKKQAENLVDSGQIDLLATDCHRIDHLTILEQNLSSSYLRKVINLPLKNNVL